MAGLPMRISRAARTMRISCHRRFGYRGKASYLAQSHQGLMGCVIVFESRLKLFLLNQQLTDVTGGEGGIRTRGGFYPSHAFQACDLNRSSTSPVLGLYQRVRPKSVAKGPSWPPFGAGGGGSLLCTCTIFIAEEIRAETSVMLLGTISVVVASLATRL